MFIDIKLYIKNGKALQFTILPLQFWDFVSCWRYRPSHMTKFHNYSGKIVVRRIITVDPISMVQADPVWYKCGQFGTCLVARGYFIWCALVLCHCKDAIIIMKSADSWWHHQMEAFSALLAICGGIHRTPVNSPHKDQWSGALMFSLISTWINCWVNNGKAGDLRRHCAHYDATVM